MDLRTGRMYETREAALADGVPDSDIAQLQPSEDDRSVPRVRFKTGPFKNRLYRRDRRGQLVRVR